LAAQSADDDLEDHDTLTAPPRDADIVYRAADHHAAVGDQHNLVVVPDREHGDDRVAPPGQVHVVDTLPAASGDAVIMGRAAHAKALFGDAQHHFLALREIGEGILGKHRLAGAFGAVVIGRFVG